jgi:hypothetical protein
MRAARRAALEVEGTRGLAGLLVVQSLVGATGAGGRVTIPLFLRAHQCIGITHLKVMTAERLRDLNEPLVVFSHSQPVAALVSYEQYLRWQSLLKTLDEATGC